MTENRRLKRLVRQRAAKTGESYTSALRHFRRAEEPTMSDTETTDPRVGEPDVIRCSFCRKTQKEVRKLVAGPGVFICDECVVLSTVVITPTEDAKAELADRVEQTRHQWAEAEATRLRWEAPAGPPVDPALEAVLRHALAAELAELGPLVLGPDYEQRTTVAIRGVEAGVRIDVALPAPGALIGRGGIRLKSLSDRLSALAGQEVRVNVMRDAAP